MTNKNAELCSNDDEEVDYRAVAGFLYVRVRVYRQVHLRCLIIARYLKRAACWKTHTRNRKACKCGAASYFKARAHRRA